MRQHYGCAIRKSSKTVFASALGGVTSTRIPFSLAFPTSPEHPRIHRFVYHCEASKDQHLNQTVPCRQKVSNLCLKLPSLVSDSTQWVVGTLIITTARMQKSPSKRKGTYDLE